MARDKPEGPKKNYGVRLSQDLMQWLKHLAADKDRRVNDLIDEAIRDLLKKHQKQK